MAEKHFIEQKQFTETYLFPYFQKYCPGFHKFKVLEVGCAEGGFLHVLLNRGIYAVGLELAWHRIALAKTLDPRLEIVHGDITDPKVIQRLKESFDLVVMREVIEHVELREKAFENITQLLKPNGFLYVSFPPKFSPFGGHHQNGNSFLRYVPYLHLLPPGLLRFLEMITKESPHIIENAILNFKNGLTISQFERLCQHFGFHPIVKALYTIRPIFQIRTGLKPFRFPSVPILREFFTLGCEYLLQIQMADRSSGRAQ